MKLRTKILLIALIPLFILGTGMFFLSADRIANGIYDEAYYGMQAASLAVRDIFEVGNPGNYHTDKNGDLWKGSSLNITRSTEIVDHIKDNTGMDVTIFYGSTRILTSIKNEAGERQSGTEAPAAVVQKVLNEGEYFLDRSLEILGVRYIACYAPFYQEDTKEPVGMVFVGKPAAGVSGLINGLRQQMLMVVTAVLLVTCLVVLLLVNHIVKAMGTGMGLLSQIAGGDLTIGVDPALLKRSDEVGMLGSEIVHMRDRLKELVNTMQTRSARLDDSSGTLKEHAGKILQLVKGLDQATLEMTASCTSQAEDACTAGNDVSQMGEMIGESSLDIHKMHEISGQLKTMSEQTRQEILELGRDMKQVHTSMDYLSRQTLLTKESADNISRATELIAAVASQTSLLSLNASIEAARAGELGRGFGVVASEIQNLSIQANDAVDDIRTMVDSLTENSASTISRMEEVRTVLQNQDVTMKKTGEVFEQVRNGILESVSHMETVITRSRKMEEIRTDMVAAVQNTAAMSQENAASIEEVKASLEHAYEEIRILSDSTDKLADLSAQMKESVEVFRVTDGEQ